jgi:hypothetical protein
MIVCKECGQENMEGLEYCDGCGAKLEASDVAESVSAPEVPAQAPETEVQAPEAEDSAPETQATETVIPEAEEPPVPDLEEPAPTLAPEESVPAIQLTKATITRGETLGKEFLLETGDNLVGRWDPDSGAFPEVDLEADDPEARVSRKHALIRVGEQITIEDMGSLNGTYVNRGPRLEPGAPVTLKDGDEIIIGKTFLKITIA